MTDWRAFAQSNGMSATIYIKEGAGKALEREVGDFLRGLAREGVWGFQEKGEGHPNPHHFDDAFTHNTTPLVLSSRFPLACLSGRI